LILGILQARVSSTRLPSKVMRLILNKPMLAHQIDRIKQSKLIDQLIVATSLSEEDNAIAELCLQAGIACFRGSLDDVLDRLYKAAKPYHPSHVVRMTGDCPLIDFGIIDQVINNHLQNHFDYTSNSNPPTFPDGLDVEIITFKALEKIWQMAKLPSEREHVTLFIRNHPEIFKIGNLVNQQDLSHLRWTVDEAEDFILIQKIYEYLFPENQKFNMNDILFLFKKYPELKIINKQYKRNEGMKKSLLADQEFHHV